ncbi:MAG: sulfur carrier protein ThiS [Aureliella sp.]
MTESSSVTIQFNGNEMAVPTGTTIADLLAMVEMKGAIVAVEVNQEVVPREQHGDSQVKSGDLIEAVTLVGGG